MTCIVNIYVDYQTLHKIIYIQAGSLVVPWVLEPPLAVLLGLEDGLHLRVSGRRIHLLFCCAFLRCPCLTENPAGRARHL